MQIIRNHLTATGAPSCVGRGQQWLILIRLTDAAQSPASNSPEKATLIGTLVHLWPYIWPGDRADLKMRVVWSMVLLLVAKLATLIGAVHLQMGDRCAQRHGLRAGRSVELDAVADRLALADDRKLRRGARADGGIDAVSRRHLRPRRDACGAQARLHHLRPHARIVAALPSGAQDRRLDARAGARPHRHRGDRADGDPAVDPDHRRGVAADGRAAVAVRLALRAGHRDHGRDLHVLHLYRDRMADRDPPQDERFRHRGEHQGDRTRCSITRR